MNIYEMYGRLAEKYEAELAAHRRTVELLKQLKEGDFQLEQLTVTGDSWAVVTK